MKKIDIGEKILTANEKFALENLIFFSKKKIFCLNIISSPGSGKTTILARTIN